MIRIRKAKIDEQKAIIKLFNRISKSASYDDVIFPVPNLSNEDIFDYISNGDVYILTNQKMYVSVAIINKDVSSYFYPKTHSDGKLINLINKTDARMSEDVVALVFLGTDPLYINKGNATTLLKYIEATFARFLFLASLDLSNINGIEYLRKNGFKKVGLENFEFDNNMQQLLFKRT